VQNIKNCCNARFFHIDGTSKMTDPNKTVIILGFSDLSRHFNPISYVNLNLINL
ncbi:hypothetical protein M153_25190002032, partial [Pseudoloma neurophilia]